MDAAGFTGLRGLWFAMKASDRHLFIMEVTTTPDAQGFFVFYYGTSDFNIKSQLMGVGIQHQLKPQISSCSSRS